MSAVQNKPIAVVQGHALDDYRVLVVPGLHGSGPAHWQSRWEGLYPAFERVVQDDWDTPDLSVWSQRLQQVLHASRQPTLIVAHSFGCLTTAHLVKRQQDAGLIAAALLVAPADPEKFGVTAEVNTGLPFPSLVVGSSNDPWMTASRARQWAGHWESDFLLAGALGHINAESGLGDWIEGQCLLLDLVQRVT